MARALVQELDADAAIGADSSRHLLYVTRIGGARKIRRHFLTMKISFINEIADLCEVVGADARIAQGEWLAEALHQFTGSWLVTADKHAIGMGEGVDSRILAQELRIRADREVSLGSRYGRLGCDHGEPIEMRPEILRLKHESEISMPSPLIASVFQQRVRPDLPCRRRLKVGSRS